jgi:branched-subunit amino acid ABC-type transport system permease component
VSHATEFLKFGQMAGSMVWSNAVYFTGILALLGGAVQIPGIVNDGAHLFVPAESMINGVTFLYENPQFAVLGAIILFLAFKPTGEMGSDDPSGESHSTSDGTSDAPRDVPFAELARQL